MNYIFKIFLTINSIYLSFAIFLISNGFTIDKLFRKFPPLSEYASYTVYLILSLILTKISLIMINFLGNDEISEGSIVSIEPANDSFLPSYLGYFFVALSVPSIQMFGIVFLVISIFIFYSRISYFNPLFFIFGYNFYYVLTEGKNKILIITKKKIKNANEIGLKNLRRINDYTFIDMEE